MGEIADAVIDGTLCQQCGGYVGEPVGFPRSCDDCEEGEESGDTWDEEDDDA